MQQASDATGVGFRFLLAQAQLESGLEPTAKASGSSARGLFQFIERTWLDMVRRHGADHGLEAEAALITDGPNGPRVASAADRRRILALRDDPRISAAMGAEYASQNADYLERRLGRKVNDTEIHLAHFLGPAGAARFLKAADSRPDASAAALFPDAAAANRPVFYDRGRPRTLAQVQDYFAGKLDRAMDRFAGVEVASGGYGNQRGAGIGAVARMQMASASGTTGSPGGWASAGGSGAIAAAGSAIASGVRALAGAPILSNLTAMTLSALPMPGEKPTAGRNA